MTGRTREELADRNVMMAAHSLCPTDMPHPERMAWMAAYFRKLATAAQAQSEPLTDERVFDIANSDECNPDARGWGSKFSFLLFARAIEAAHGITKE